jgi:hypothetical protein
MISLIHEATTVNTGQKDRKTNMEIKKPYAVFQYNKGGTVAAKLCTLQCIFCVQDTKYTNKKVKYKNFSTR